MSQTTLPSLDGDDNVALGDQAKLDTLIDTPPQTLVNILLPNDDVEVWLLLGVLEGVDATVQVGAAGSGTLTGNHEDWAGWAVLGAKAGSFAAKQTDVSIRSSVA